jgi:autotransporter-associated beta strand protein
MSRTHCFAAALWSLAAVATARGQVSTWTDAANNDDWNTAGNWSSPGVPNSATATVKFTGSGINTVTFNGTINISSSVQSQSLTFSNGGGTTYNLFSSPGQTLSGVTTITLAGRNSTVGVGLNSVSTGNLLFPVASNLTLTNNADLTGELFIGSGTVIGTPGVGGVVVTGPGSTQMNCSFATGGNAVAGGLTKNGPGVLTFAGSGVDIGGGLTLNGGTLGLDYSQDTTSKSANGPLTVDGGLLTLRPNSSTAVTQAVGGLVVAAGHTDVQAVTPSSGTVTLAANGISRTAGATADFTPSSGSTTFAVTTNTGNTRGLLGSGPAFATLNGGATWAIASGGGPIFTIAGVTSYGGFGTNINTDVTAPDQVLGTFTSNSLRFNTPNINLFLKNGTATLQSGGILVTPAANGCGIQDQGAGVLKAANGVELIIHVYAANGFTIFPPIGSTAGLTKTGPGTLTLAGDNVFGGLSGPININRGGLTVLSTTNAVNSASAINFNDDRSGTQLETFGVGTPGLSGTITPPIRLSAYSPTDYGTYFTGGGTLAGVISSAPGLTTPIAFQASSGVNGFNLTGTNTFTGAVALKVGFLGINADSSLGNPANTLVLDTNDVVHGGLVFLNGGVNVARPVTMNSPTRLVVNGTDSNTISGAISGAAAIDKEGAGTLTLTNPSNSGLGGVIVNGGTLSLGASGGVTAGADVTVAAGAAFVSATAVAQNTYGTVTLNGGTFSVPGGANHYNVRQLVTSAAGGTVDFTGATGGQLIPGFNGGFTVNGTATFLSPGNAAAIVNTGSSDIPFSIVSGVTLTNGLALGATSSGSFLVTGGGTLSQNSDATNVVNMTAPIKVIGSRFRVTDASTAVVGQAVGNLGTGTFTLDGGTFDYAGATNATAKAITLTANGGTLEIESAATTLTANGAIGGPGPLTKIGPGTLALGNSGNSFAGLTIANGTVQILSDAVLGSGPLTVNPLGTLLYGGTTTTTRNVTLNSGALAVAGGQTLTVNGGSIGGGFVLGPGTVALTGSAMLGGTTTAPSLSISVTGTAGFGRVTNGATVNLSPGLPAPISLSVFTNQGSGTVTVGAMNVVNVSDFQSSGVLTINPAPMTQDFSQTTRMTNVGASPLFFNGGGRTFVGTPDTAVFPNTWPNVSQRGQPTFVAGIDLNGKSAVVAGGLFVNNGYVEDSTNNFQGTATIVADFGSLVKGSGFFQNSVQTVNGGKFQAGNSPGVASFGKFILGPGGVASYVFAINDATGVAGPMPDAAGHVSGWSLVNVIGTRLPYGGPDHLEDFAWTATPAGKLTVSLQTLLNPTTVGIDVPGRMDEFDPSRSYTWRAVVWTGSYAGPADDAALDAATTFDTNDFVNPVAGTFGWALDANGRSLSLAYTPSAVPEPGTALFTAAAGIGMAWLIRRRPGPQSDALNVSPRPASVC